MLERKGWGKAAAAGKRPKRKANRGKHNVKWQLSQKAGISDSRSPVAVLVSVATS